MNSEQRIKQIHKETTRVGIIDTAGAELLGLGPTAKIRSATRMA